MAASAEHLPYDLGAEEALLGAALLRPAAWVELAALLKAGDFYRAAHQRIFEAMADVYERGMATDFTTVRSALETRGHLDDCGGPAYLAGLVDGMPAGIPIEDYATIVRDKAQLREVILVAEGLRQDAYGHGAEPSQLVDRAITRLLGSATTLRIRTVRVQQAVSDYLQALDSGGTGEIIQTGYLDLDHMVGGMQVGDLAVVAARPSVGKSSWSLRMADMMASSGHPVAFVSLEMSQHALAGQVLSWRSQVPSDTLRRREAEDSEYLRVSEAVTGMDDIPLFLVESATNLTQVVAVTRRLQELWGVRCVVIDYLQRLMPERRGASREADVSALSVGLKRLATDLKVAVVALAQLNRASEARTDKRPLLSDLRESGGIEADADLVLLLYRAEMHKKTDNNEGIAEVIVAKNRTGPTGVVKLSFDKRLARFANLAMV